jgi:hypothetical protein
MSDMTKFDGWDLDMTTGEPRVRDLDIATRAGLVKPADIRRVIVANWETLSAFGEIRIIAPSAPIRRGPKGREYWLTEEQATSLVSMLKTPLGKQLHVAIVRLFVAYRRGQLATSVTAGAPLQARIGDDPRAMSLVRTYCQLAAHQSGLSVHRIQGRIRKPWGVMSIYRIALSSLDHTIAQLKEIIEAPRPRALPRDRRQVAMPWGTN